MQSYPIPVLLLAAVVFLGIAHTAHAKDPLEFRVGKVTVWAIADAIADRDMSVFKADDATLKRYVPTGKAPSAVMAFVVKTGKEIVLIDTGYGRDFGDTPSMLLPGLAAIGLRPDDITTVLITHMHGDHIGGLVRKGEKAFPKARVLIGRQELAFWLDDESRIRFPARKANFDMARNVAEMYKNAIGVFDFNERVVPEITALDAVGHTPGHTAFMIESDGDRLLCVADLLHAAALQFPRPDINASYDMNPEQARAARERILMRAADEKLPIAGMHLPFPGIGRVEKAAAGYRYLPGLK